MIPCPYDRAVFKGEVAALKAAHDDLIAASRQLGPSPTTAVDGDFTTAGSWSVDGGPWRVDQGSYVEDAPGTALVASHFANLAADVAVTVPAGGEAGLVFRASGGAGALRGYGAGLSATGLTLSCAERGAWRTVKTTPFAMAPGGRHHLRIEAFGGTIRCFVDDLGKPALEVTDYRAAAGAVGVRATGAGARFSGFAATDPFVRLRPLGETGFVIHNSKDDERRDVTQLDRNVNRDDDALWRLAPGLADPQGTSFASARLRGWYLRDRDGEVVFAQDDGSAEFKRDATWKRVAGLAGTETWSYESPNHPGEYLRVQRPLVRRPARSEQERRDASFIEMR